MKLRAAPSCTTHTMCWRPLPWTRKLQEPSSILSIKFADIVYNGQWYTPLREALTAFVNETQKTVTGDVKLKLYKGNIINAGVTSPYTLYDEEVATFDAEDVYNQKDAEALSTCSVCRST